MLEKSCEAKSEKHKPGGSMSHGLSSSSGSFVKQLHGCWEVTRYSWADSFPWASCFQGAQTPLGGEPSSSLSYTPLGISITARSLPLHALAQKEKTSRMPDKEILLPVSRFALQEPEGPDWVLEMLKCRRAANTLPDQTMWHTSSKWSLATVPHLSSQRDFR